MVQCRNRKGRGSASVGTNVGGCVTGNRTIPEPADRGNDVIGVHGGLLTALDNGLLDHLHGIFGQQLQDPNVLPRSACEPLALLEVGSQLVEAGGQFPLGKHKGMIQSCRPATENCQIMLWLHDPFAAGVAALVTGNHSRARHDLDPIDIRLDRHRIESPATRNTVAVRIESHRLILVHFRRLRDERIEGPRRQSQGRLLVLLKELSDGLCLARHHMVSLGQRARPQVRIQLG